MSTTLESPATADRAVGKPSAAAADHPLRVRAAKKTPGSKRTRMIVLALVGAAAAAWAVRFAIHSYHYQETEDAYVTGHLHQVSAQISGQVAEVRVNDNQQVKAGDVLARLDPLEFQIAEQRAEAAVAQARAQQAQAEAGAQQAEAQIAESSAKSAQARAQLAQTKTQLDLARLTLSRNEELFKNGGAVTQADVDNARTAFNAAQAAFEANQANVKATQATEHSSQAAQVSAQAQAEAAKAAVGAANAAVRDAKRQLGYATIVAPADGVIGNKAVENGNRVQAGQILFALAEPEMWIVANFKETQLPRMKTGQPVEITVDALPGRTLHGTVESLAPASGAQFALLPPDNATGNFNKVVQRVPVKIVLDAESQQQLRGALRMGLSVVVKVRVR